MSDTTEAPTGEGPDPGCLPAWRQADLPEPLPFSLRNLFRTIGPGAILLAAAIGGGEWIVGPKMAATYGSGILWVATVAIVLQIIFNLEGVRYTLFTGEPILTGVQRLRPGPATWAVTYISLATLQLATPALASGSASVLFAAFAGRLPVAEDGTAIHWVATGVIIGSALLLLCGKSIEKVLERASWIMIIFIFAFLISINVYVTAYISAEQTWDTFTGFLVPRWLPADVNLVMLALFAATAGSGGIGNLCISNWFRDKGFGMAKYVGGIGGALAAEHQELARIGCVFPTTESNLQRWRTWWRYAEWDQVALWGGGCFLGMFLNVNLMLAIAEPGVEISGYAVGTYQAQFLAAALGNVLWYLTLLNGFWIVYSTHLGNTDALVRTISDILWSAFPGLQRWPASRLYASLLGVLVVWGVFAVRLGSVDQLFAVLGIVASPIMALAAIQILRVNTKLLPQPVRPALWRQIGLVLCAVFYGGLTVAMVYKEVSKLL